MDSIPSNRFFDFGKYDDEQLKNQLKRGVEMIAKDSIDSGMQLVGITMDQLMKTSTFFRKLDYSELEILSIVRDCGLVSLSKGERKLRDQMIRSILSKDTKMIENEVKKAIRKNKNSELLARVRLLVLYFEKSDQLPLSDVDDLLATIPDHGPANLLKGKILLQRGEYQESIQFLTKAIDANPVNAYAYFLRGACYLEQGELNLAISEYTNAIKLYPNYDFAYNHRGDAYYDLNKFHEAISDYDEAIKWQPKNQYFWKDRANAYVQIDEYWKAIKDFEKSISLEDQYDYAYKRIGDCYHFLEEYERAIVYCNKALIIDPNNKYALVRKGLSYGALNLSHEAIIAYKNVIEIDPEYSLAYGNTGWEYYRLGAFEKCIEFSEKAVELYERATYAMFNIALANLRLGKIAEAKALYIKYRDFCQANDLEISQGVIQDLWDVRDQQLMVEDVNFILSEILESE